MPLLVAGAMAITGTSSGAEASRPSEDQLKIGQELFSREWKPDDPRSHGGDGLGPVYNATSCLACHGLGGPGGAGPAGRNSEILSVVAGALSQVQGSPRGVPPLGAIQVNCGPGITYDDEPVTGSDVDITLSSIRRSECFVIAGNGIKLRARAFRIHSDKSAKRLEISCAEGAMMGVSFTVRPDDAQLMRVHPGLTLAPSTVLHHFGVDPRYDQWRTHLRKQVAATGIRLTGGSVDGTGRNPIALFGAGLIDAMPEEVILATMDRQPLEVRGRVSRMPSGRIGRFGWKAQVTTLQEFVLAACANELGLEVPDHHQAISPLDPDAKPKGLDLTQEQCDALVAYVRELPTPVALTSSHVASVDAGRELFGAIGCATCHTPELGGVEGIYSDLLLHDMGPDLESGAVYYGGGAVDAASPSRLAGASEWRTPPLWGMRDSGPYLHDGRAQTLNDVVKSHKGQAGDSRDRFFALSAKQHAEIIEFLNTLAAPPSAAAPEPASAEVETSHKHRQRRAEAKLRAGQSPRTTTGRMIITITPR